MLRKAKRVGFGPPWQRVQMPHKPLSAARSAAATQLLLLLLLRRPQLAQSSTLEGSDLFSTSSSSGSSCVGSSCVGSGSSSSATAAFDGASKTIAKMPGPTPWLQATFDSSWRLTGYQFSVFKVNPATQPPPTAWVARCEKPGNTTLVEIDRRTSQALTITPYFHIFTFAADQTQGCTNVRFDFLGYDDASSVPPPVDIAGDSAPPARLPGSLAEPWVSLASLGLRRGRYAASACAMQCAMWRDGRCRSRRGER